MSGVKSTSPEVIERWIELGFAIFASPERYFVVAVVVVVGAPKRTKSQTGF